MLNGDILDEHKIVRTVTVVQYFAQCLLLQHAGARDVADAIHTQAPWKQEPVRDESPYVGCNARVCLLSNEDAKPALMVTRDVPTRAVSQLVLRRRAPLRQTPADIVNDQCTATGA